MANLTRITPTNMKVWTNRHETFTQPIDNLFDISNGNTGSVLNDYNNTTEAIQQLMAKAINEGRHIRVLGGGWSFTKIVATDGWILNTRHLNMLFSISQPSVSASYTGQPQDLLFVQCGNSVYELNKYLKSVNRSLKTSGASNGQTIIGAFSTGTHGSAIDFGATQDFIVGLHIITSPGTHIYLERASYPVASDDFVHKIKAQLVRNDDWFNAALVSFGSFGFIHGVMIETDPLYLLQCYRQLIPNDDVLTNLMQTLDFSNSHLNENGSERPFHFQSVVNPYNLAKGAYVTVMYKRPYTNNYTPYMPDTNVAGPGDDAASFIGKLTNVLPAITPLLVNKLTEKTYQTYSNVYGTSGEIFYNTDLRGKVLSTAMGIAIADAGKVNGLLIELNKNHGPFPGVFSYRYVKKTNAILGFTKFDHTCIIELDGVESQATRNFYDVVWNELEAQHIPYTFHWGKVTNLNADKIMNMYGMNRYKWLEARNQLLPPSSINLFNNQTLADWGLDRPFNELRPF